jgi:hypothetical protein
MAKAKKDQKCPKCGGMFHWRGIGPHKKACNGKRKAVVKKQGRKGRPPKQKAPTPINPIMYANIQIEIDVAKGLELGVIKFVSN